MSSHANGSSADTPTNQSKGFVDALEENLIALILALMTVITFANVIARYVFNTGILWGLELTVFLFAWLVLIGASYAVKVRAHLGVDLIINSVSPNTSRLLGLITVTACILYGLILFRGSWDYWAPYANLPPFDGRVFPTGFTENFRERGWYETQDIPVPFFLKFLEDWFNYGEAYEKLPKTVPYIVMPLSMALLTYRFVQAGISIFQGKSHAIIASHEAEDAIEDLSAELEADIDSSKRN